MERGMRQKSRRRNSGEDVKIMIKLEIELEIELENEPENGPMNVLEIVLEIELEIELENGPMNVLLIVLEIALDIDHEFKSHFKISSLLVKFHSFVFALMDLSPRKMEKAGEAIDFLSSLPGTSGGSTHGTSTDSGNLSQLFNRVFSPHPHTKFYSAINFYNFF